MTKLPGGRKLRSLSSKFIDNWPEGQTKNSCSTQANYERARMCFFFSAMVACGNSRYQ